MANAAHEYIIVIGGSYVGVNVAQELATQFHRRFHVLLIEKNSHFQHLFAFPRFAVTTAVETEKAFIPYVPGAFASCPPGSGTVLQASVIRVDGSTVQLDRTISLDGNYLQRIPYTFLVLATGATSVPPSSLPAFEKHDGVSFLRSQADHVASISTIAIIGGGAVGVQMATDIKEIYPEKSVTLIHSRETVMNRFHRNLDEIVKQRCTKLGVRMKLGARVKLPAEGYPTDGRHFNVELEDGSSIPAQLAIICTGQTPQSGLLRSLSPQSIDTEGYIRARKTLQIIDAEHPRIFAVGDVAATGAAKAAKPGRKQAGVVCRNIEHMLKNEPLEEYTITEPPGIHLTLGIIKSVAFGNPVPGSTEPFTKHRDDGRLDMNIDAVWTRRGGGADANL